MAPTSAATHLDLTVIRASEIKWHSTFRSELPNLYIQVVFGKIHRRTRTVKRSLSPEWHEHMSFELRSMDQSASLSIQIKHDSSRWRDKYLGKVEVAANELLNSSATSETAAILHLRLEAVDTTTSVGRSIEATKQAIQTSSILGSAAASDSIVIATVKGGEDHVAAYNDLYQSVGKLVSKLDIFVGVIDKLSEAQAGRGWKSQGVRTVLAPTQALDWFWYYDSHSFCIIEDIFQS
ncbi:C2-domain-containing protein [Fomitiporia mediterranea MF3/22]|uniref:C2-domain-containing protein n=1 Tax=Fomitiporia mediterranea (strain MF3/22) TaxID=694068 RepID=UPI0004408E10|nr:C2-domain-containing protein [Fomitiporia mediterranea MF3/22]EJD04720.1 C2-domain-containing protein [Fomitiporia mediterranea MF3/22]